MAKTKTKRIQRLKKHLLDTQSQLAEVLGARGVEPVNEDEAMLAALWSAVGEEA